MFWAALACFEVKGRCEQLGQLCIRRGEQMPVQQNWDRDLWISGFGHLHLKMQDCPMGHRFGVLTLLQKWVGVHTVNTCRWKFLWSGVNPEQSYRFQWSDCGFTPLCNWWQDCLGGNLMIGEPESRERLDEAACVPGKQHKRTDTQFYAFIK